MSTGTETVAREVLVDAIERTLIRHADRPVDWQAEHLADVLHATGAVLDAAAVRDTKVAALAERVLDEYDSDQEFLAVCIAGARVALGWDRFRDALNAYTAKHP